MGRKGMLRQSFVLLPHIRQRTEQRIWEQDVPDWNTFVDTPQIKGLGKQRKERFNQRLQQARQELINQNSTYFTSTLPQNQHWRLYDEFRDEAVFLDIETSGYYGDITVLGLFDGMETTTLVRGQGLDKNSAQKIVRRAKLLVTFNGTSYDLPVLKRYFNIIPNVPHIDLRFVCKRLGFVGGLKAIERRMGIQRPDEVADVCGEDAVYLWQQWRATGRREYLERLVLYNEEDIVNLKTIADRLIPELWQHVRTNAQKSPTTPTTQGESR